MIFSDLLPAKQQQLPEALRLFADVLRDGHERVRQEGQRSGARLFLGPCQRLVVEIDEVGLVGAFARQPNGAVLLQQEVGNVRPHHGLNKGRQSCAQANAQDNRCPQRA